jgi:isoleucyl-tRNA synthetase
MIGNALEAKVELYTSGKMYEFLKENETELPALFIVSQVAVINEGGGDVTIKIAKADGEKCERCWNYNAARGLDSEHPTLCPRCTETVNNWHTA